MFHIHCPQIPPDIHGFLGEMEGKNLEELQDHSNRKKKI